MNLIFGRVWKGHFTLSQLQELECVLLLLPTHLGDFGVVIVFTQSRTLSLAAHPVFRQTFKSTHALFTSSDSFKNSITLRDLATV